MLRKLTILVHPAWLNRPEIQALQKKGHTVRPLTDEADLILHPGACRWTDKPDWWEWLDEVVREWRKRG